MKSLGYKKYLFRLRLNKWLIIGAQLFILVFLILLWQMLADYELINTFITSSPRNVVETVVGLYQDSNLFQNGIFIKS